MFKRPIVLFLLCLAAARAEDADPVAKWLTELGSNDFGIREGAKEQLIAYIAGKPGQVMEIGHRLMLHRQNAAAEVAHRIGGILERFVDAERVDGPDDANLWPDFFGEGFASIRGLPVFVILVTSGPMFGFYRNVVQVRRIGKVPKLDFKEWLLVCMNVTSLMPGMRIEGGGRGLPCLKSPTCRRDFEKGESIFTSAVGVEYRKEFQWPKTTANLVEYLLHVDDLPLIMTFSPVKKELTGPEVRLRYQVADAKWRDVDKILKEGNLFAFRKLAEACDATIAADTRRDFLQRAYMIDPLLPYVMFTNLAAKHPDLFDQDYEYWKDKAPNPDESIIVGKLFRAALEEGKKIVEQKEKGKQ